MRIYHNQLAATLKQAIKPVWLIFGDEPWQKNESLSAIKQQAKQQGFDEIIRFSVDDKFDWQALSNEYQALSLFASRRIIELEVSNGKVGDQGGKVLVELAQKMHTDVLLLLHGPRLDAAASNRKWFKSLAEQGCYLPLYDLEGHGLTQWLQQQARQQQVKLAPDATALLIELFEGNLLALAQELQKLSLLFSDVIISSADVEQAVIKQAKFNPFQIIDALLIGDLPRCIRILAQLQQEGSSANQLVWVLHKEITQLRQMQELLSAGQSREQLFQQFRVWDKRKPLYQHALTHINYHNLNLAQARLAQVDLLTKTTSDFNAFILLADICLTLYHGELTGNFALEYEFS